MKAKYILHIEIKSTGEHLYSNSLNVLLEKAGYENTGVSAQSVRNYFSKEKTDVYENDKCIVRRGRYYPLEKPNVSAARKKAVIKKNF